MARRYRVASSVLDTEDVSYVSSAYIPACLRQGGRPTMSNAHRATESGASQSTLRDELDVVITLNSVSVIVAEYIPFGANQSEERRCRARASPVLRVAVAVAVTAVYD